MKAKVGCALLVLGVAMTASAEPRPPSRARAAAVATRWLAAIHANQGKRAAALMTRTARVGTVPCKVQETATRAALIAATPAWRYCLPFSGDEWSSDDQTGPGWRDLTMDVGGESFGTLRIRVTSRMLISEVAIVWAPGGV